MATHTTEISDLSSDRRDRSGLNLTTLTVWAHVAVLLFHLPALLIYMRSLWDQPHYQQFYLFALFAAGVFVYMRLQTFSDVVIRNTSFWPNCCLVLSLVPLAIGTLIFDVNWIFIGLFFVIASLLGRIVDRRTLISLFPAALILLPVVRPPSNLDIKLITKLQQFTSYRASEVLDAIGISHNLQGNTIVMPGGGSFLVEEACSGVQSLFTLLFCSLAFAAFERRRLLHTCLLVLAAAFWAAFGNTLRVISICLAETWGINLADGFGHIMLGYATLLFGIAMLYCTDRFLAYLLGSQSADESESLNLTTKVKKLFFPHAGEKKKKKVRSSRAGSRIARVLIITVCVLVMLLGFVPLFRIGVPKLAKAALFSPFNVKELGLDIVEKQIVTGQVPRDVTWEITQPEQKKRDNNSDWGSVSNQWVVNSDALGNQPLVLSCDYPFLGYHELTVCYRGNGWRLRERKIVSDSSSDPFIQGLFDKPTGEKAILLFSLFESDGKQFEISEQDILNQNIVQRAINSFNRRYTRDYGPLPQTYQVQVFAPYSGELTESQIEHLHDFFVIARKQISGAIIAD